MVQSRKRYIRDGDYMEVRVAKSATYSEVVACAIEALGVQEEEEQEGEGEPRIFRIDGTVVPDSDINGVSWTIARYLSSLHKSAGQIKLGVGYQYQVSMRNILLTFVNV